MPAPYRQSSFQKDNKMLEIVVSVPQSSVKYLRIFERGSLQQQKQSFLWLPRDLFATNLDSSMSNTKQAHADPSRTGKHHLSPTSLSISMLMIPQAHPSPRPRLTPTRIIRNNHLPLTPQASRTEHLLTCTALVAAEAGLQDLLAKLAGFARAPVCRSPCYQAMALDGFGARTLELHAQLAQEFGVPFVFVRFEEAVRFLVGEEIED